MHLSHNGLLTRKQTKGTENLDSGDTSSTNMRDRMFYLLQSHLGGPLAHLPQNA